MPEITAARIARIEERCRDWRWSAYALNTDLPDLCAALREAVRLLREIALPTQEESLAGNVRKATTAARDFLRAFDGEGSDD